MPPFSYEKYSQIINNKEHLTRDKQNYVSNINIYDLHI